MGVFGPAWDAHGRESCDSMIKGMVEVVEGGWVEFAREENAMSCAAARQFSVLHKAVVGGMV